MQILICVLVYQVQAYVNTFILKSLWFIETSLFSETLYFFGDFVEL